MADKTIGELDPLDGVTDSTMIPAQDSGAAGRLSGQQFRTWAVDSVASQRNQAEIAAAGALLSKGDAQNAATAAAASAANIASILSNLVVEAVTLEPGSSATVTKTVLSNGSIKLTFGIPQGVRGYPGEDGDSITGPAGPQGSTGGLAQVTPAEGTIFFNVGPGTDNQGNPEDGHLLMTYAGSTIPSGEEPYYIDDDPTSPTYGHLMWVID